MTRRFLRWLGYKWRQPAQAQLVRSYHATFSTPDGQLVLQDLLDKVYCLIYEGTDVQQAVILNARRSVVQEILENIDLGEHPSKYVIPVQTEIEDAT